MSVGGRSISLHRHYTRMSLPLEYSEAETQLREKPNSEHIKGIDKNKNNSYDAIVIFPGNIRRHTY